MTTAAQASDPKKIVVTTPFQPDTSLGHNSYILNLLKLALERSKKADEVIELRQSQTHLTQARQIAELQRNGELDLLWTMTSIQREAVIRPVRIPILKGLLGQRVFLIRKDRAKDFSGITTLPELADLMAGQGSHWPDTPILRHNGLSVVTTTNYQLLFDMLAGGRFDYFPRGANEAWQELAAHPKKPLQVEPSILLSYIAPMYFFVHPDNQDLAERLQAGMTAMYQDGSFDRHFYEHPSIAKMIKGIDMRNRRVFELHNPLLPEETPVDIEHYWLKLKPDSELQPILDD